MLLVELFFQWIPLQPIDGGETNDDEEHANDKITNRASAAAYHGFPLFVVA
jgi:hypothetical protein